MRVLEEPAYLSALIGLKAACKPEFGRLAASPPA